MNNNERAKHCAKAWTAFCKQIGSMAFAEASDAHILLKYQKVNEVGALNLRTVKVVQNGFDVEGVFHHGFQMPLSIEDDIEDKLHDWASLQNAKERRQCREGGSDR